MAPGLPERTSDTLVVVGTAPGAPSRLRQFAQERPGFDVAAVNAGGLFWEGPLKLWVSYHPTALINFSFTRLRANFPMGGVGYVSDAPADGLEVFLMQTPFDGTSSMLATWAGVRMGYPSIVLIGVEINDGPYAVYRQGWAEFLQTPDAKRVRSLSGWTSTVFGKP